MILDIIKAAVLGVVEGITEFLPISSTGHLILVNGYLNFNKDFTLLFDIVIQLGAILAVIVFFWKKLWPFTKNKLENSKIMSIWYKTIIGVLPAIVLGKLFADTIEEKLFTPWTVAIMLLLGGLIIIYIENKKQKNTINSIEELGYNTAFFIGLIQCLAMIPGTSRSAATIIGALIFGASRTVATEFSFFLAIPTMIAATGYSLLKYGYLLDLNQLVVLATGFIVSFVVALAVIKFLINYIKNNNFKIFGFYRIILGIIIIVYFLIK